MVTNIDINSNNNSSYLKYHMILKVERSEKLERVHDGHGHFYTFFYNTLLISFNRKASMHKDIRKYHIQI